MHDALIATAVNAFAVHTSNLLPHSKAAYPTLRSRPTARSDTNEGSSNTESEEGSSSDDGEPAAGDDDIIDEADFDADGLRKDKAAKQLRPDVTKYETRPTKVRRHARFIPGREQRYELDSIELWELSFFDI